MQVGGIKITVLDMVRDYLEEHNYDGLCLPDQECGCSIDDLAPCGDINEKCRPAYFHSNGMFYVYPDLANVCCRDFLNKIFYTPARNSGGMRAYFYNYCPLGGAALPLSEKLKRKKPDQVFSPEASTCK